MKLKLISVLTALILLTCSSQAEGGLRTLFLNNQAVICEINIRNFNADDTNGNEIIDNDEESGNFINAIDRLDEIKTLEINTLHVLPVTPIGKLKSLGTAGSVYAMADLESVNHQIIDLTSSLTPQEQMKLFISECRKRGIYVIIDLPCCGAYDLFLTKPELFIKDKKQLSIIPADWTDVRLFNAGSCDDLNQDLLEAYKRFVDMVMDAGADGIRADAAYMKPPKFWEEIINYSRQRNPEFLFLAEASDSWKSSPSKYAVFTPYDKLLEAGFDGYYGSFFNFKDWKSDELIEHIKFNKKLLSSYPEAKSVILSFTTHDEVSPVTLRGENFSVMICWLEATLPFNPYFVDGFQSGDDYLYRWSNTKAPFTETDDDYYFVHRGKIDIFNYSRKPGGKSTLVSDNFKKAFEFRKNNQDLITKGSFNPVKTKRDKVFAYTRCYEGDTIIVAGNLDFKHPQKRVAVKVSGIKKKKNLDVIHGLANYRTAKNKLYTDLEPGEIKVWRINNPAL